MATIALLNRISKRMRMKIWPKFMGQRIPYRLSLDSSYYLSVCTFFSKYIYIDEHPMGSLCAAHKTYDFSDVVRLVWILWWDVIYLRF